MKKVATSLLISAGIIGVTTPSYAESEYDLELSYSEEAIEQFSVESKSSINSFSNETRNLEDSKIKMKINKEDLSTDKSSFLVEGELELDGTTAPFKYEGELGLETNDSSEFYKGPLSGTVNLNNEDQTSVLGIYYDEQSNDVTATISIGELGESEVDFLYFGELSDQIKSNLDSQEELEEENFEAEAFDNTLANVQNAEGPYLYASTVRSGALNPGPTLPHSDVAYSNDWSILDTDGENGKIRARVFTNTEGVSDYFRDKYEIPEGDFLNVNAVVTGVQIQVSGTSNINFSQDAYPREDSTQIEGAAWYITEALSGTPLGKTIDIVSNLIPAERVNIAHTTKDNSSTGNRYSYRIDITENLFDTIDYEEPLKRSIDTYDKDGGLSAFFPYIVYPSTDTSRISTVTRVQYGVSALPYFDGYVEAGAMTSRYELD